MPPHPACRTRIRTLQGKHGSLPTDTGSPFAVIDPASSPPTPQHGSAVSHRARPHPACRACIRTLQREARLTLCGKPSGEHAASPAARGMPSHTVPAPGLPGTHTHAPGGNPGSLPTDTGMSFAIIYPMSTPPAPPHGECLSRLRLSAPSYASGRAAPTPPPNSPHSKKQDTPPGVSCFSMGSEGGYALAERI